MKTRYLFPIFILLIIALGAACDSDTSIVRDFVPDEIELDTIRIHQQFNENQFNASSDYVYKIAKNSENSFYIGGRFTTYGPSSFGSFIEIDSLGNLKPNNMNYPLFDNLIRDIRISNEGEIIVAGDFENVDNRLIPGITTLTNSGPADTTFKPPLKNGIINSILNEPGGGIIIAGTFTELDGKPYSGIGKLLDNGTLDTDFFISSGFNGPVYSMTMVSNDKLLVTGNFSSYRSFPVNNIVKVDLNGVVDSQFSPNSQGTNGAIDGAIMDKNGKIIIWGAFSSYNGTNVNGITRINPDGTIDPTFKSTGPADGFIWDVDVAEDGKIWVGGSFSGFFGKAAQSLIILNEDGSPADIFYGQGFSSGISGIRQTVFSIKLISNTDALIGGNFIRFNGAETNKLVRLSLK